MIPHGRITTINLAVVVLWPVLSVWLTDFLISSIKDSPFYFEEELFPRVFRSILAALPFIVFAIWAQTKTKTENVRMLKSVAWTFYFIASLTVVLWIFFLLDLFTRTEGGANIGLGMLGFLVPILLSVSLPLIHSVINKRLRD